MYTVILGKKPDSYYNVTLISADSSHFLNIYINKLDENINVSISKSEDGFYFKIPCDEANDLELNIGDNLEETYNYVINHFLDKGYKYPTH